MVGPAILFLCTKIATSHKETRLACRHAFEASVVHTGHNKKLKKYARTKETEYKEMLGEDASLALISMYTVFIRQEVSASIRGLAYSDSAVVRFNPHSASITLNWRF